MNTQVEPTVKTIKISSTHKTLLEAVTVAGIDLSYNKPEALSYIKLIERNVSEAYVCEDGKVRYVYVCDIKILNEFEPFIHCISDSPFQIAMVAGEHVILTGKYVRKDKAGRQWFARNQDFLASLTQTLNAPG